MVAIPHATFTPVPSSARMISAKPANDSSVERRTFARLWLSDTESTSTISSTRAAAARSAPRGLATSATYPTAGWRRMPAITASASASAGTALGDTKDVTSILCSPVSDRRSTSAIFSSVGMKRGSIWKPSRVTTSWT